MPLGVIGLTGNIATGKSTVAAMLQELGATVINADQIAREVVVPGTPAFAAIVQRFGPSVVQPDGFLDRRALGRIVFADQSRLRELESIVHPPVRAMIRERLASAPHNSIVVLEVIRLFESGLDALCDAVWVTHCSEEQQRARLIRERGFSADEAEQRIRIQSSPSEKIARADVVIDTGGSLEETRRQVEHAWRSFLQKVAAKRSGLH
ncbi:MAG: dephospho-CoA kinase [Thermoflexales bacterium]|nr:dephospho-CoA kinase [Thermoflexales bacterium]MCS7324716.1 dephospho-CoA kinase [Thermoflexales bacterium]MCX7939143.1 dephospho-CoA kinase [Thermoflexales bacterium]MDW8054071.1 dephospho-CoA kinase [Anaerolineae bacterium]MDW8292594.1 dephospho-CoA kinase [Anaerolineae bacterium]